MNQVMFPRSDSFSFPSVPDSIKSKYGVEDGELLFRLFGQKETDLDINFLQPLRPQLVTEILHCCTEKKTKNGNREVLNPAFFWDLTISMRVEALLEICTLGGTEQITAQVFCSKENCDELMEIQLSREEILSIKPENNKSSRFQIQVNGKNYTFRKPTGNDQLEWQKSSYNHEDEVVETIMQTLWVVPRNKKIDSKTLFSDKGIQVVNKEMLINDPLTYFKLTIQCPSCKHQWYHTFDLEGLLLKKLHEAQKHLLYTIHSLASYYHWSEQHILALSPRRRNYYLSLINQ